MDKKVELQVLNISNSQAQVGAYAMVLGEVDGERQLPIIIGPAEGTSYSHLPERNKGPTPTDTRFILFVSECFGNNSAPGTNIQSQRRRFLFVYLL